MDFLAPPRSKERKLFVDLRADFSDLGFTCRMTSAGKVLSTRTLTITSQQQQMIGLEGKLFGDASEKVLDSVYVTKNQMKVLSSEIYAALNIAEDYQILEGTFADAFLDELINQIGSSDFAQVPIADVLGSLSKYGFGTDADLDPASIKNALSSMLMIEKKNKLIILNEIIYARIIEQISDDMNADLLEIATSANWARDNSKSGVVNTPLAEQLRDLNSASLNGVQWIIQNDRVVPKSLNVASLSRAKLGKTLTFNKVRSQTFIAPFDREVAIYTNRVQASTPFLDQVISKINNIQAREDILATELGLIAGNLTTLMSFSNVDFNTILNVTNSVRTDHDKLTGLKSQVVDVIPDVSTYIRPVSGSRSPMLFRYVLSRSTAPVSQACALVSQAT